MAVTYLPENGGKHKKIKKNMAQGLRLEKRTENAGSEIP